MELKKVSVIVPVRNEERYIRECVESIFAQDYPTDKMEVIFADGCSTDGTVEILNELGNRYPQIVVLNNPGKTAPCAMNVGIKAAKNEIIVRLDAHAEYPKDYIRLCVETLLTKDCEDAGGCAITKGRGFVGSVIAEVLSTPMGVGNSSFRIGAKSGYVDTVPFGCFRKSLFDRIGLYDERLTRNQDNEMSYRIRKNGGKIYLNSDIRFTYYCRDTIRGIMRMGYLNGLWSVITMKLVPGTMGLRHFVPMFFTLSLLGFPLLMFLTGCYRLLGGVFALELMSYMLLAVGFSFRISLRKGVGAFFVALLVFPAFHIAYGAGSLVGLLKVLRFKRN